MKTWLSVDAALALEPGIREFYSTLPDELPVENGSPPSPHNVYVSVAKDVLRIVVVALETERDLKYAGAVDTISRIWGNHYLRAMLKWCCAQYDTTENKSHKKFLRLAIFELTRELFLRGEQNE